jgi:hypothetical protein
MPSNEISITESKNDREKEKAQSVLFALGLAHSSLKEKDKQIYSEKISEKLQDSDILQAYNNGLNYQYLNYKPNNQETKIALVKKKRTKLKKT